MKLDAAFQIGKTHDICEDFALISDENSSIPFTIVSDGCSSSPNTDVGSRILTFSAIEQLEKVVGESKRIKDFNHDVCMSKAINIAKTLNISPRAIDATLLMMAVTDRVEINILGDGAIAIGTDDGDIFVLNFEYPKGYPFYMSYLPECSAVFTNWKKNYSCKWCYPTLIRPSLLPKNEFTKWEPECTDACFFLEDDNKPTVQILGWNWDIKVFIELKNLKWVTIMSDGINSFYKTENTGTSLTNTDISHQEVIKELLNFKNFNGKFMQRRLNRFLKFCQQNNWYHADDISFGTIYFGDK